MAAKIHKKIIKSPLRPPLQYVTLDSRPAARCRRWKNRKTLSGGREKMGGFSLLDFIYHIDQSIMLWLQDVVRNPLLSKFLVPLTTIGYAGTLWIILSIVMLFFRIPPTVNLLAMPILLVFMLLFCAGLGMLLSSLAVFFRDVCHLWGVVITAWTYATPLFYPVGLLPDWMQAAEAFNPMYHYVCYFRDIAMYNTVPGLTENLICLGMAAITFAIGFAVFKATEKKFILYV